MTVSFAPRTSVLLQADVEYEHPVEPPELVHPDSPAAEVMTDFRRVCPVTVDPGMGIEPALEKMRRAGVRLLLVTNEEQRIIGLVTAYDILGEKPIKLSEEARMPRGEITVEMVMAPQTEVAVLDMVSVQDAQVGHIVETLNRKDLYHILVVETDEETGRQRVRGLFSLTQIRKQLGRDAEDLIPPVRSLAQMLQETG